MLALALGALLRRAWLAILVAVLAIAVPYVVTSFPPLPAVLFAYTVMLLGLALSRHQLSGTHRFQAIPSFE
ncbi:hypothetical protein [Streptomyces sp. NPDC059455]|uniref:hypothetical protein n=1 Tax=Streptomyces sp. NPDC059455 TaxID=3346837 RepID=UPI0036BFEE29